MLDRHTVGYRHTGITVNRHARIYFYRGVGNLSGMTLGARIDERRRAVGIASQAELARRARLPQTTLNGIINRPYRWSPHIVRIAQALRTTPAYLTGETDDPAGEALAAPQLDVEARELVEHFDGLSPADRRALLQVARSMANGPPAASTVHSKSEGYREEDAR